MKTLLRSVLLIFGFSICVGSLFLFFESRGDFDIQSPKVFIHNQGNDLPLNYLKELQAHVSQFNGRSLWSLSVSDIEKSIIKRGWIEDVSIRRTFPNRLRIEVFPKQIVGIIIHKKENIVPITEAGELLGKININQLPPVPILESSKFYSSDSLRKSAGLILSQLPKEGPLSIQSVTHIKWNAKTNKMYVFLKDSGTRIHLGTKELNHRVSRVERVLRYLTMKEIEARVIDADFEKKVVVKLRNHG